jgi:multicomponent Na+:H+ antiporter subunit D
MLAILIPLPLLLAAVVVPLVGSRYPRFAFPLSMAGVLPSFTAAVLALIETRDGSQIRHELGGWAPPLGIEYLVDQPGAFVSTALLAVAALVLVGTRRTAETEFGARLGFFYGLALLVLAGILGMVVTHDLFNLFVFMEIGSVPAYALVFAGGPRGMLAGFRYLILGSIGGSFYLLGVGFIYFSTGSLNMSDVAILLEDQQGSTAVAGGAIFIFVGLGLKMALFPLHLWLPDAYTHAPSSVSALIAPVMTKAAAFAMFRMIVSVFPSDYLSDEVPVGTALIGLGLIGMIVGAVVAASQTDYRRMLAYSSISQLGMIGVALGLATPLALAVALLHMANHAVMKACLFLVAVNVRFRTGSNDVDAMAGLGRTMPVTMGAWNLAALAMIGVPPFAGFFSKVYLAQAGIEDDNWLVVAMVLVASLATAAYLVRVVERAYFAADNHTSSATSDGESVAVDTVVTAPAIREAPLDMLVPTLLLGVASLALGLANVGIMTEILEPGVLAWGESR